ncbi:hypothetical protein L195_g062513, partial [Trifolium pratense]
MTVVFSPVLEFPCGLDNGLKKIS